MDVHTAMARSRRAAVRRATGAALGLGLLTMSAVLPATTAGAAAPVVAKTAVAATGHPGVTTTGRISAKKWAKKKFGSFTSKTYRGSGDDVIRLPKSAHAALVTAKHHGDSNFAIVATTSSGAWDTLLVNEIGSYKGTTAYGVEGKSKAKYLEITADGAWTIKVRAVDKAPTVKAKKSYAGDQVLLYDTRSAKVRTFSYRGDSNFAIWYRTASSYPDLLVNEIDSYKGRKLVTAGPGVLVVSAAGGKWSVR